MNLETSKEPNNAINSQQIQADALLEKADILSQLGEFKNAIPLFEQSKTIYLQYNLFDKYLHCQNRLIRLYAEIDEQDKVLAIKDELQDAVLNKNLKLSSRSYYLLGIGSAYRGQLETAYEYGQKSLSLSLETDNKEDTCYAISLLAAVYRLMGKHQEALRELYNLKVLLTAIHIPEIKASSTLLNALILIDLEKYDEAIEILWQAYEILKLHKSIFLPIQLFGLMAQAYRKAGQIDLAWSYLKLADRMIDPLHMVRLNKQIQKELKELNVQNPNDFDLIFNESDHEIFEKKIGRVDFRNQFVLLDLLKLFVTNPGKVFSKEYLVERIWQQTYDPAMHDNKVYVTIKRLRKMIEPDFDRPKYIFRSKNGYYMNKAVKLLVRNPEKLEESVL